MTAIGAVFHGHRLRLLVALVLNGLAQAALAFGAACLVKLSFDWTAAHGTVSHAGAWITVGALAALTFVRPWLRAQESVLAEKLAQDFVCDLRLQLFDRMTAMTRRSLESRARGAILLRFVGDIQVLRDWVGRGVASAIVAAVTVAALLTAIFLVSGLLAWIIGSVVVAVVAFLWLVATRMRDAMRASRSQTSRIAARLDDRIAAMQVIQAFRRERAERRRLVRANERLAATMVRRAKLRGWAVGAVDGAAGLATLGIVAVAAFGGLSGSVAPGTLAAGLTLVGLLAGPLADAVQVFEYRSGAEVAFAKIREFLALPVHAAQSVPAADLVVSEGKVEFREVSVAGALQGFSASAVGGRRVAITGPNGSGKSALLRVAAGLLTPDSGIVLIDGQRVDQVTPGSLRRAVAIAGPEFPLMRGSVRANLRGPGGRPGDDACFDVLDACGLGALVRSWPKGLGTRLLDGGANLTSGQRVRFGIARALLQHPSILLLDDVEAHLDVQALGEVAQIIRDFPGTVLFVARDPRRLDCADSVWRMADGALEPSADSPPVSPFLPE